MTLGMDRRAFVGATAALLTAPSALSRPFIQPNIARVILDNDFAGDPDGLFQLAHHLLCRSVSIRLIIGSHLPARFSNGHGASDATMRASEIVRILGLESSYKPIAGAEIPIPGANSWKPSAATAQIVAEAMRNDVTEPLIYAAIVAALLATRANRLLAPDIKRKDRLEKTP